MLGKEIIFVVSQNSGTVVVQDHSQNFEEAIDAIFETFLFGMTIARPDVILIVYFFRRRVSCCDGTEGPN